MIAFVERGAHRVLTAGVEPEAVAAGLVELADRRRRRTTIASIDGDPVTSSPLAAELRGAGFRVGYRGLTFHRARSGPAR
jgi:hypothetical protein